LSFDFRLHIFYCYWTCAHVVVSNGLIFENFADDDDDEEEEEEDDE